MKKMICMFLALILVIGLIPTSILGVSAENAYSGSCGDNAVWTFDPDSGTLTISGTGIVARPGYFSPDFWYDYKDQVCSIVIQNGITEIGDCIFTEMKKLTSVTLPDSLRVIGLETFWGCEKLTQIRLNDGLKSIGERAFAKCGLTQLAIPASISELGEDLFFKCYDLQTITVSEENSFFSSDASGVLYDKAKTVLLRCPQRLSGSYTVPEPVKCIAHLAFADCTDLIAVTLPGTLETISRYSFSNCSSLIQISLAEGLQTIEADAFINCENLKELVIPASVQQIGSDAFTGCVSIERYYVDPASASFSSDGAGVLFNKAMTELIRFPAAYNKAYSIPEGVTHVSSRAFFYCRRFTELELPASLKAQEPFFLDYNSYDQLRKITVSPDNQFYSDFHGVLYNKDKTELIFCPRAWDGVYEVAPNCKIIQRCAFMCCTSLTGVILPSGLEEMRDYAFYDCPSMKSIRVPASVTQFGYEALGFFFDHSHILRGGVGDDYMYGFTIFGYKDSRAQVYADNLNFDFYDLDEYEEGKTEFDDVSPSDFYARPVHWAVWRGITAGTGAGSFSPNRACTRAELITMLWRAKGSPEPSTSEPPFEDVRPDAWYAKAVCWAVEADVSCGTSATTFSPDLLCTRAQAITLLWKAASPNHLTADIESPFTDVDDGAWYANSVLWAYRCGITSGTSPTTFSPDLLCTRAQIVTFFWQVKERFVRSFGKF